ncbi:TPA: hypothetical protein QEM76_000195 [Pseudomonas putida]|uniref:hypothetical protein n=1 Tax=Pseudomonas putida TaxID=303 RepID=UPI00117ACA73|nr:hypothetical protein [Pseudomonas putida]HDS1797561.1 hypothetical protein [Pseudomonas putida]HDS1803542.1 hypothetical protein [Pseudomonas putida]
MTILAQWKTLLPRGLGAALVAYSFYRWPGVDTAQLYSASGVIAGVCATLLGFLVTAVAIVTALVDKTLIANMRKTGHYRVLMRDTFLTCAMLLLTLGISCAALVTAASWMNIVGTAIAFLLALSLLYAYESGRRFALVVMTI